MEIIVQGKRYQNLMESSKDLYSRRESKPTSRYDTSRDEYLQEARGSDTAVPFQTDELSCQSHPSSSSLTSTRNKFDVISITESKRPEPSSRLLPHGIGWEVTVSPSGDENIVMHTDSDEYPVSDHFEDLGLGLKVASEAISNLHGSNTCQPPLCKQFPATTHKLPPFALKYTQSTPTTSTLRTVQLKRARSAPSSSLSFQPNGIANLHRSSTGAFSQPALKKSSSRHDVSTLSAFYPVPLGSQKRLSGKRTNRCGYSTDLSKIKIQKGVSSTESLRAKLCARASKTFSSIRRRSGRENPAIPPSVSSSPLSLSMLPVTGKSRLYTQHESQSDEQECTEMHDVVQMEYDEGVLATRNCFAVTPLQNQTAEPKFGRSFDSCPVSENDFDKSRNCSIAGSLSIDVDDYCEDKSVSSSSQSMSSSPCISSACISSPITLREGAMVSVERWFGSAQHPQNASLVCEKFECLTKKNESDENINHMSQSLRAALIQSPGKSNLPCIVAEESSILLNMASMPEMRATKRQNIPLMSLQNKPLTPNSNNQVCFSFGMSIGCRTPSPQVIHDTSILPVSSLSPPRNIIDLHTSSDALRVRVARPQFRRRVETSQPSLRISPSHAPKIMPQKFTSFYTHNSLDDGGLSERLSDESLASVLITPESTHSCNYFSV